MFVDNVHAACTHTSVPTRACMSLYWSGYSYVWTCKNIDLQTCVQVLYCRFMGLEHHTRLQFWAFAELRLGSHNVMPICAVPFYADCA